MSNAETTVLYALSTIAQTCAALAAFVGAVGLYRLQALGENQERVEREVRALALQVAPLVGRGGEPNASLVDLLEIIERAHETDPERPVVREAVTGREAWWSFAANRQASQRALMSFEAWNLGVIFASLVCFAIVPVLARWPYVSIPLLFIAAGGTVRVTWRTVREWTAEGRPESFWSLIAALWKARPAGEKRPTRSEQQPSS